MWDKGFQSSVASFFDDEGGTSKIQQPFISKSPKSAAIRMDDLGFSSETMRISAVFPAERSRLKRQGLVTGIFMLVFHGVSFSMRFGISTPGDSQILELIVLLVYSLTIALSSLEIGFLMGKFKKQMTHRNVLTFSIFSQLIGLILAGVSFFFSGNVWLGISIVGAVFQGIGTAAATVSSSILLNTLFPKNYGLAIGFIFFSIALANTIGPLFAGAITEVVPNGVPFFIFAGIGLPIALILRAKIITGRTAYELFREDYNNPNLDTALALFYEISLERVNLFAMSAALGTTAILVPLLIELSNGIGDNLVRNLLIVFGVVFFISSPLSGYFSDVFGVSASALVDGGIVLSVIGLNVFGVLFQLDRNDPGIMAGMFVTIAFTAFGLQATLIPTLRIAVTTSIPISLEMGIGVLIYEVNIGGIIGGVYGLVLDQFLDMGTAFALGSIPFIILLISVIFWIVRNEINKSAIRSILNKDHADQDTLSELLNIKKLTKADLIFKFGEEVKESGSIYYGKDDYIPDAMLKDILKKRKLAYQELITTERSYVLYMKWTVSFWVIPLLELASEGDGRRRLKVEDVEELFDGLKAIRDLHVKFYSELSSALDSSDRDASVDMSDAVALAFANNLDEFQVYSRFVEKYNRKLEILSKIKLSKKFQTYANLLQTRHLNQEGIPLEFREINTGLNLESLLIMPIQRVPRYVLLINEILRQTPDARAYFYERKLLENLLAEVQKTANNVNDSEAGRKNDLKLFEIQDFVKGYDQPIFRLGRAFIREATVNRITGAVFEPYQSVKLFLFNDIVLITSARGQFKDVIRLPGAQVIDAQTVELFAPFLCQSVTTNLQAEELSMHIFSKQSPNFPTTIMFEDKKTRTDWELDLRAAIGVFSAKL